MSITVSFPGGVAVEAKVGRHTVRTDQPSPVGNDAAPSPFDLFLASIATCMGFYALRFCQERNIANDGLSLSLAPIRDETGKHVTTARVTLQLPKAFPAKYHDAIRRAVDHCSVKRHMLEPPAFEISIA
jgi:putative redox protein